MCVLNPSSVRSQTSKDESNWYVLIDEESMYSIIPRKDSRGEIRAEYLPKKSKINLKGAL